MATSDDDIQIIEDDLDATFPYGAPDASSSPINSDQNSRFVTPESGFSSPSASSLNLTGVNVTPSVSPDEKRSRNRDGQDGGTTGISRKAKLQTNQDRLTEIGCPLYSKSNLSAADVAKILLDAPEIDRCKLSTRIPPFCPGKGEWSFVLDLSEIDSDDLSYDEFGKWGRPSGHKFFYANSARGAVKVAKDKAPTSKCFERLRTVCPFKADGTRYGNRAVICYIAECDPKDLKQLPHKNAKNQESAMVRTKPSVLKKAVGLLTSKTPKQTVQALVQSRGGVSNLIAPSDVPKNTNQIRNASKKVADSKSTTAAGRPGQIDYDALGKLQQYPGSFLTHFDRTPPSKENEPPGVRLFLCDPRSIEIFKMFGLKSSNVRRPLKIDMTYGIVNGLYVTPVIIRNPQFVDKDTGKEAIVCVCMALTTSRTQLDYEYLARQLIIKAELSYDNTIYGFVTDGEPALISGLTSFPNFANSTHVRCELHMRENVEAQLRGLKDEVKKTIVSQIFGSEVTHDKTGRDRSAGLADAETPEEFDALLSVRRGQWERLLGGPEFVNWFEKNTAATIKQCYLAPIRRAIGIIGRITTNDSENFNSRLSQQVDGRRRPAHQAITLFEKFIDGEFSRLQMAVYGQGDFRLSGPAKAVHETSALSWSIMGQSERDTILFDLNLLRGPVRDPHKRLSVDLESETSITEIGNTELRRLQHKAIDLLSRGDAAFAPSPTDPAILSVWDQETPHSVKTVDGRVQCINKCRDYQLFRYLCPHTLAVAEKRGELFQHITFVQSKLAAETVSQALGAVNAASKQHPGDKPGTKRRGTMTSAGTPQNTTVLNVVQARAQRPITLSELHKVPLPTAEDLANLVIPKAVLTQPFHNDHNFQLILLNDFWKPRGPFKTKVCKSCNMNFSGRNVAPENIAFVHWERFQIPAKNGRAAFYSGQNHLRPALVHIRHACLIKRYPYVSHDLLVKDPNLVLEKQHKLFLKEQLGIDNLKVAQKNWRSSPE